MSTTLSMGTLPRADKPSQEGELYKIVNIKGKIFELRYGYYEEIDRASGEPDVIYPDLIREPQYTEDGLPIVTLMQDACRHFIGNKNDESDCSQCAYFERCEDLFGICRCPTAKKNNTKKHPNRIFKKLRR